MYVGEKSHLQGVILFSIMNNGNADVDHDRGGGGSSSSLDDSISLFGDSDDPSFFDAVDHIMEDEIIIIEDEIIVGLSSDGMENICRDNNIIPPPNNYNNVIDDVDEEDENNLVHLQRQTRTPLLMTTMMVIMICRGMQAIQGKQQ